MPRAVKLPLAPTATAQTADRLSVLILDAAIACGWRRANSFRERFMRTDVECEDMGLIYDEQGRARVDADAVDAAADEIRKERATREPNWRIKNLKSHARKRKVAVKPKANRLDSGSAPRGTTDVGEKTGRDEPADPPTSRDEGAS